MKTFVCERCGVEFRDSPSGRRRFCSRACAHLARRRAEPVEQTRSGKALSANVRRLRLARGMSQDELAERAGCTQRAIAMIEIGYRAGGRPVTAIGAFLCYRLAVALGCPMEDVLGLPHLGVPAVTVSSARVVPQVNGYSTTTNAEAPAMVRQREHAARSAR